MASSTNCERNAKSLPNRVKPKTATCLTSSSHDAVKEGDTSRGTEWNKETLELIPVIHRELTQFVMDSSEQDQMSYANQELVLENLESLRRALRDIGKRIDRLEDKIACR